jgi:site-specific DNA recombinase
VSKHGSRRGGKPFSRGALYHLLSNPIYVGQIRHKKELYPGQHEAIVNRNLWQRVQQRLNGRATREGEGRKTEAPRSPLAGKLFDENGEPLYIQGAAKGQRRYRYYVSRKLVRGAPEDAEHGWRVSAPEIERAVAAAAKGMLSDRVAIAGAAEEAGIAANRLPSVLKSAEVWIERLRSDSGTVSALTEIIERLELSGDGIRVVLRLAIFPDEECGALSRHIALTRFVPMQMKRRGVEMRMVLVGASNPSRIDLPLLKAVARARKWSDELLSGRVRSVGELARREGIDTRSVRRLIRLGALSPRIVETIIEGRQPPNLTVLALTRRIELPLLWSAQEQALVSDSSYATRTGAGL